MRTLLHVFPTFDVGGAQIRFVQIANRFAGRYRHQVVSLDGHLGAATLLSAEAGVGFVRIDAPKKSGFENVLRFRKYLSENRPDLLVTSNWGSIEWAIANLGIGIPHLHTEDGFGPDEQDGQKLRRRLVRRFALRNAAVIVPSQHLYGIALRSWRIGRSHLRHIPNGADTARFSSGSRAGNIDGGLVIGTIATLRKEKNLKRLIDAFARVSADFDVRLLIAGDGPERGNLEAHAAKSPAAARITFTGYTAAPEQFLSRLDVFALSSDTEQMPLSLLEAMAAGCPVAATSVGDVPSMVAAENRPFLVERSTEALADAFASLLRDPTERKRVGEANRRRAVESFDSERMLEAYRRLWDGELTSSAQEKAAQVPV